MLSGVGVAETAAIAQVSAPVPARAVIPVLPQTDETLYFTPDAIYELPVIINAPITVNGRTLPAGTVIQGRLEPVEGGLRYVTTAIEVGGFKTLLSATSNVLEDIKDPRETSIESIAGDAAIGAAGGAVLGVVLGDGISVGEVIGGAAAGVIVGNVTAQRVVIIEPQEPLILFVR
jgi:hypothetical protein